MSANSIASPLNHQQPTTKPETAAQLPAESPASRTPMSEEELGKIVLPLTAFVAANSSSALLVPQPRGYCWDRHDPAKSEVRVRFRLDPRFFREETVLDKPLMALLRANRRGFSVRRPILRMSLELFYEPSHYSYRYHLEAALVISAKTDVQSEPCLKYVNSLLCAISRPGYICPLTDDEREELGRSPGRSRH